MLVTKMSMKCVSKTSQVFEKGDSIIIRKILSKLKEKKAGQQAIISLIYTLSRSWPNKNPSCHNQFLWWYVTSNMLQKLEKEHLTRVICLYNHIGSFCKNFFRIFDLRNFWNLHFFDGPEFWKMPTSVYRNLFFNVTNLFYNHPICRKSISTKRTNSGVRTTFRKKSERWKTENLVRYL